MIEICGLTKVFGTITAVDGLDLTVERGQVFGFLGPNGAGKTTTIKMLVGLIDPTAGTARIEGHDVVEAPMAAKQSVGFLPDHPFLYDYLTPREFLFFLADVRGLAKAAARIEELLAFFELEERADRYCTDLSYGMRKKLALAGAILHEPALLILDEPTNGMDPLSVKKFRELVASLAAGGTTVFLSTHILEIAEKLCSRVGIICKGRLVADGTPEDLQARVHTGEKGLESVFIELTAAAEAEAKAAETGGAEAAGPPTRSGGA